MERPKVFLIILSYNGREFLGNCLRSVSDIAYPNFSVLVIDNDSKDGSAEMVESGFSRVKVLRNPKNPGFAGGNNLGIKYALENGADYVLLLNQDTEVEPDFLEKLISTAENDPKIGVLSPLIFWGRDRGVWYSGGRIDWLRMRSTNETKICGGEPYETQFVTGCSMLIKRSVIDRIGCLSEKFFMYWEDADFSFRARKSGFKTVVVPESRIYHFEASGLAEGEKIYRLVLSGLIFFKRNAGPLVSFWVWIYTDLRRIKNFFDTTFRANDNNLKVKRAYIDFKNGNY